MSDRFDDTAPMTARTLSAFPGVVKMSELGSQIRAALRGCGPDRALTGRSMRPKSSRHECSIDRFAGNLLRPERPRSENLARIGWVVGSVL
jgi:hypothetical protein